MYKSILTFLLLFSSFFSYSSAILGGDMSLHYQGSSSYKVTLNLLNNCAGSDISDSIYINYQCITNDSLSFRNRVPTGLSNNTYYTCAHSTSTCNGGSAFGYWGHLIEDIVTLHQQHKWKIWIKIIGRGIDDVTEADSISTFYLETIISLNLAAGNSTPQFFNPSYSFNYVDNLRCYNHGIGDPNGDSLSFSFIHPMLDSNVLILYNPGFDQQNFIPSTFPISINPTTGDICYQPSNEFVGITKVLIEEWRTINGQVTLIGYTQRDIVFHSLFVQNNPPVLSGMDFNFSLDYNKNDTIYYLEAFATDTVSFRIHAYDIDSGMNAACGNAKDLIIYYDMASQPISYSNITIISNWSEFAYADFIWAPKWNEYSNDPYIISMIVHDHWGAFMPSGRNTFQYQIMVKQHPNSIKEAHMQIEVFPNPSKGEIDIKLDKFYSKISLRILNIFGQIVLAEEYLNIEDIHLNTNLTSGIYFLQLRTSDKDLSRLKVIIE